jgi:hypothetical protein
MGRSFVDVWIVRKYGGTICRERNDRKLYGEPRKRERIYNHILG